MPVVSLPQPSLSDCYVLIAASDGTCVLHPRVPKAVGMKPWDFSHPDDREDLRERFVRACMFRESVDAFQTRLVCGTETLVVTMQMFPLDNGQVLVTYSRVFDEPLTPRERMVLAMFSGGSSYAETAQALRISESTVRDHIANLKRKLRVETSEALKLAARSAALNEIEVRA